MILVRAEVWFRSEGFELRSAPGGATLRPAAARRRNSLTLSFPPLSPMVFKGLKGRLERQGGTSPGRSLKSSADGAKRERTVKGYTPPRGFQTCGNPFLPLRIARLRMKRGRFPLDRRRCFPGVCSVQHTQKRLFGCPCRKLFSRCPWTCGAGVPHEFRTDVFRLPLSRPRVSAWFPSDGRGGFPRLF